jgi:hypothetical protein
MAMAKEQKAQEGFLYEKNTHTALKAHKLVDPKGAPAGASHTLPDITIIRNGKDSGLELKISPTAAGSLVMKYANGKWAYGDYKGEPEKQFLHDIGEKRNLLRIMNSSGSAGVKWRKNAPALRNDPRTGNKILAPGIKDKATAYKKDIANFGGDAEIHIDVPAKSVCDYYNAKGCYYLNVGTHGFFLLNGKDPLGLNAAMKKIGYPPIQDFANSADCKIRVRCQLKSSSKSDYQFVMTLQFSNVTKQLYNIAPLRTGSKSSIDTGALKNNRILAAFDI